MILTKYIEIKGNGKTINFYKDKGYDIKCNQKIIIKIDDLIETSSLKIDCLCDICNSINNIKYYNYIGNVKRNGLYRCNECSKEVRVSNIKFTFQEKSEEIISKTKNTNKMKYGFDSHMKNENIKNKMKKTNIEKYGYECCLLNENIKDKIRKTLLDKYGVDSILKSKLVMDKIKNTILNRYGVDNVFSNKEIRDKIKETLIEKYGVDNPTKNPEIFDKAQKSSYRLIKHNDADIYYQGTYELDFIFFCIENKITFKKGPVIDYSMNGKDRKYFSDFYLPDFNLICEIKSSWTYNRDLDENLVKEEYSKKLGYNFLFLIDKNYNELEKILSL